MNSKRTVVFLANAASIHTQKWAAHFADLGYCVHILSFHMATIKNVKITYLGRKLGKLKYVLASYKVRQIIRQIKPDILHAHYAGGYGLLGALVGYHPYIVSVWGSDVHDFPQKSVLHEYVFKFILNKADYICSTSHSMAQEIYKYANKSITITPFGVDCNFYKPLDGFQNNNKVIIGTVKTLEAIYGIDYLIRAFSIIKKRCHDLVLELVIVGGGPLMEELKQLSCELGINSYVKFVGEVEQNLVPEYLNGFSVYVALSTRESFGVAVLEASSCGVPVVVSDAGGLPEVVVNGETGFVVPSTNIEKAADAIEILAKDKNLRQKMGNAGRRYVMDNYQWKDNATIMETLYGSVAK